MAMRRDAHSMIVDPVFRLAACSRGDQRTGRSHSSARLLLIEVCAMLCARHARRLPHCRNRDLQTLDWDFRANDFGSGRRTKPQHRRPHLHKCRKAEHDERKTCLMDPVGDNRCTLCDRSCATGHRSSLACGGHAATKNLPRDFRAPEGKAATCRHKFEGPCPKPHCPRT